MNSTNIKSFIRVGKKPAVSGLVKEAKRVGYTVTKNGNFSMDITDPSNSNARVVRATNMGNCWAITYYTEYWSVADPRPSY